MATDHETIVPVLVSKLHLLIQELSGRVAERVLTHHSPTDELTSFIPEDLVARKDGRVSLLGIINTMLERLGEERICLVKDVETGICLDADYVRGEGDGIFYNTDESGD